ncbi:MAG: hypothetical protein AABX23_05170 [Nanoarchaeota archaeon]
MRNLILIVVFVFLLSFVSAQVVSSDNGFFGSRSGTANFVNYGSSFSSYYGSNANTYWPIISNRDECTSSQDILVQISPAGCQPTVVRSDLLAEQNVPVFCQLDLLQVNPVINIKQIRNIRFNGQYPNYVAGVGFHPANAALRTTNSLLGTPLESNIGYVVVVLKRNPDEKTMPDFFNFTLSASIDYYSGNAVGIGATELLLKETNNDEWEVAKNRQILFGGKMSVRVRDTDSNNSIKVELYSGDVKYSEMVLQKNQAQPNSVYLPGSYCQTALQFSYSDFVSPSAIARIQVDDDILDLYQGSRFLNNKCVVKTVTDKSVEINCGREPISLTTIPTSFVIGDKVYRVNSDFSVDITREYIIESVTNKDGKVSYKLNGEMELFTSDHLRSVSNTVLYEATYGEYEQYIVNATNYYESIANDYGNLRKQEVLGEEYGEVALSAAIDLAVNYDKKNTASRLINKYIDSYPNGKNKDKFIRALNDLYIRDSSLGTISVESDDGFHLIKLIDISPAGKKSSAKIFWGEEEQVYQGQTIDFNIGKLTLLRVRDYGTIDVQTVCNNNNRDSRAFNGTIRLGATGVITSCGVSLRVNSIEFEDYVRLRISPVTRSGTITNFSVGVGIEKRAIELTPSKAQKKIENLNESIKKWGAISNSLGEVVTGLKTACFATAGVLTVKNFFTGLSGEALARRGVMSGEDGWTKFCQSKINDETYDSLTECYNSNSVDIGKDVEARKKAITDTNALTQQIEDGAKYPNREGGFSGTNFNDTQAKQELIDRISTECSSEALGPKSSGASTNYSNIRSLFPSGYNVDSYSYTQLRDIYFNCQTLKNGGSSRGNLTARAELDSIGYAISERLKYDERVSIHGSDKIFTLQNGKEGNYFADTINSVSSRGYQVSALGLTGNTPVQIVEGRGSSYLVVLDQRGDIYAPVKVHRLDGKNLASTSTPGSSGSEIPLTNSELSGLPSAFKIVDSTSYNNKFAPGETTVRYFETEPYKGLPAIVPFDLTRGFYAATTQALPIFGGTKSYEDNGRPSSFFVCNVMKDSNIGFYAPNYGDDECVQFNLYTGQSFSSFPGLSESDTKKLVTDAIKAINEAHQQYGKSTVRISGNQMNVGRAASLLPGSQCQDYMSPQDCKILFNVCDPVICPASRCNFGGEYYVSDVVQSGVVGSVLLCLPNIKEGIVVPVCLTGIKAGIDGYLSILKSHQQCLQEAVETGKYVGICDQVSSVYLCEFFWRQAAPLAKSVIPKLVEHAYSGGQGNVRGGGEYMTVQSSWQNAQDSANYFTQSYAVNSLDAFKIRSIEEAGTEICRAFVSAKGPKTFETLVEPDSPPQFHAWYSSIDFTDATIPATSQYKVFYHIFAGQERGVSYSVYLKDPPVSSQYASAPFLTVATGFVARGQYATESKDFTAPKGYQQLCVRINDKEECGFKQVSSSFAVNYVRDSIVSDELTRTDITTETECVSGSINPGALLNPNLQSSVEEALNPAIYNRGIVRVCATDNPGSKSEPSRYVKVGICGSERLVCWLDKNSLDKAITDINVGLQDKTLSEVEQIQKQYLDSNDRFVGSTELDSELNRIKPKVDVADKGNIGSLIMELDGLYDKAAFDHYKAEILLWKARAYGNAFINSLPRQKVSNPPQGTSESATINQNDYTSVDSYDDFVADAVYLQTTSGKHYQVVSVNQTEVILNRLLNWGNYDRGDFIKISETDVVEISNLLRYTGSGDLFDSSANSLETENRNNGERILSFEQEYRPSVRNRLLLNGKQTPVLFFNNEIIFEGQGLIKISYPVGRIDNGKIIFDNDNYVGRINEIFGTDSYALINRYITVDQIKQGIDLEGLMGIVSGSVIVR